MDDNQIIKWLLEGDASIQYQVQRDLLGDDRKDLQDRINLELGYFRVLTTLTIADKANHCQSF